MTAETPTNETLTDETKVDVVAVELEARWTVAVPLSEFGDRSYEDTSELEDWLHDNTDLALNALDLKLIQGDEPIEVQDAECYQGTPPVTTEWPDRDPKDSAPYSEPVPSFVSRFNMMEGKPVEESPVTKWNDDRIMGGVSALQFALGYCSIGERQKSHLMPFWYELLHALYARPTLHKFVAGDDETACVYCTQADEAHKPKTVIDDPDGIIAKTFVEGWKKEGANEERRQLDWLLGDCLVLADKHGDTELATKIAAHRFIPGGYDPFDVPAPRPEDA